MRLQDVFDALERMPSTWAHHGRQGAIDWLEHELGADDATPPITELGPDVYWLDGAEIYGVRSGSTSRIHQVTYHPSDGSARCDGPHCCGGTIHRGQPSERNCRHIRKVLDARRQA